MALRGSEVKPDSLAHPGMDSPPSSLRTHWLSQVFTEHLLLALGELSAGTQWNPTRDGSCCRKLVTQKDLTNSTNGKLPVGLLSFRMHWVPSAPMTEGCGRVRRGKKRSQLGLKVAREQKAWSTHREDRHLHVQ